MERSLSRLASKAGSRPGRIVAASLLAAVSSFGVGTLGQGSAPNDQWPAYGGDPGGSRFSTLTDITPANVAGLEPAWTYRTGELGADARDGRDLTFEATPLHFDGRLYLSTAFGRVIALDGADGREIWTYDAHVDREGSYSEVTSRGVSAWRDREASPDAACARRIFAGTIDARLIALDAVTGQPCADFGTSGTIDLTERIGEHSPGDYQVTSPPAILRDLVIIGASIGDNFRVNTGSGVVRAFDARTGAPRWNWQPSWRPQTETSARRTPGR